MAQLDEQPKALIKTIKAILISSRNLQTVLWDLNQLYPELVKQAENEIENSGDN